MSPTKLHNSHAPTISGLENKKRSEEVAASIDDVARQIESSCDHSHHIGTCMKKGQTQLSIQLSEQDKVLSSERVDSIDPTKVDFTFILKVTNSFFKNFQTHLDRNYVLSSNAVPNESNRCSIRSLWVPNYRGADFTQTLPCQRGLKLALLISIN